MVNEIAEEFDVTPIIIQCVAPENIVKTWLEERLKTKTVSDGRWEIYQSQKKIFEPFKIKKNNYLIIDMSKDSFEERKENFNSILLKINGIL